MDYLVRGVTRDGEFRFAASTTTALSNEARRRHATASGATKILGETMTAAKVAGIALVIGGVVLLNLGGAH